MDDLVRVNHNLITPEVIPYHQLKLPFMQVLNQGASPVVCIGLVRSLDGSNNVLRKPLWDKDVTLSLLKQLGDHSSYVIPIHYESIASWM